MLSLEQMTKVYPAGPGEYAGGIREADFSLEPGTFFTMLGPSGCGKTTTLRCIAGLEEPDSGRITVGNVTMYDGGAGISVPLHRRNIGMVFQSYAIWPHMSVAENVSFPLRVNGRSGMSRAEIAAAVEEALRAVGLDGYGARSATQLSGGQQQRVALARAIVHRPKLLLLDEPLSNLDATLREDMGIELKRLQAELGITAVYVTHDQTEALAMSDQIAVIDKGRVVQFGSPRDIYYRPSSEFVASFVGHTNLLRGLVLGQQGRHTVVEAADGRRLVCANAEMPLGSRNAVVSVRPEDLCIQRHLAGSDHANRLEGRVTAVSFLGNLVHYTVVSGSLGLRVEAKAVSVLDVGDAVTVSFAPDMARVLEASA